MKKLLILAILLGFLAGCSYGSMYPPTYSKELLADPELMAECGVGIKQIEGDKNE